MPQLREAKSSDATLCCVVRSKGGKVGLVHFCWPWLPAGPDLPYGPGSWAFGPTPRFTATSDRPNPLFYRNLRYTATKNSSEPMLRCYRLE